MAELDSTSRNKTPQKGISRRSKKLSTRVDLTPMVDLGFLLITFFIITTSLSQSKVIDLPLPNDSDPIVEMPVKKSGTITLLLGKNHLVYYYEGKQNNGAFPLQSGSFGQIRDVIITKKRNTPSTDFFVIIKPTNTAVYDDVVKALNEMIVNNVKRYALVDATKEEEQEIMMSENNGGK